MTYTLDPVHEGYVLHTTRKPGFLKHSIYQIPFRNLEEILRKANRYSTLGAEKMTKKGKKGGMFSALFHGIWAFTHHYVIKLGFLDGWPGFVIALGNFEGTFYKYAKLYEIQSCEKFSE
jgi:hypothetical protein